MKALVGLLAMCLLCSSVTATEDLPAAEKTPKFFLKSYSTVTWTFLSSFTSVVPYTCYTTDANNNPETCDGRRRRRGKKIKLASDVDRRRYDLASSGDEDRGYNHEDLSKTNQEKFFFTIWSTSSTTVTVTTFSTNRSVSVSASVMCTYAGNVIPFC